MAARRSEASRTVRVPPGVIALIADLRAHLQENCEPPIYVSDRRLVKAIGMLQVRVRTGGRACGAGGLLQPRRAGLYLMDGVATVSVPSLS